MSISIDTNFPATNTCETGEMKCPVCFDPVQINALADVTTFKGDLRALSLY